MTSRTDELEDFLPTHFLKWGDDGYIFFNSYEVIYGQPLRQFASEILIYFLKKGKKSL